MTATAIDHQHNGTLTAPPTTTTSLKPSSNVATLQDEIDRLQTALGNAEQNLDYLSDERNALRAELADRDTAPDPWTSAAATPKPRKNTDRVVYTVREAADLLGLSLGSTYTLVRLGEIPARQLGTRWVIPKTAFHAWLDEQQTDTTTD